MDDENTKNLKLFVLQEYYKHGLPARIGVIKFFLEQLQDNLKSFVPHQIEQETNFDLTNKQKLGLLQIGTISHLMLLIEDIATIFTAFKSGEWDYYKYLDRKGSDDLGATIGKFYSEIEELTDEDIRSILGYSNPRKLENFSESDKDFLVSVQKKNIHSMRYFLTKSNIFWGSHIAVFRRYKHAGFPILLGTQIPENDSVLKGRFDFVSFALTSKGSMDEITAIPFSQKAIESYRIFMEEMFTVLFFVLENNLIKIERLLDGIIPNSNELFTKRLTKKERKKLSQLYATFMNLNKAKISKFNVQTTQSGVYPTWYVHLDTYVKSSIDLAIERKPNT